MKVKLDVKIKTGKMNPPNSKACFTSTAMSEGKLTIILLEKNGEFKCNRYLIIKLLKGLCIVNT